MNNCEDKLKLSCPANSPYANCVRSEVTPPEFSTLTNSCNSVDEVLTDTYSIVEDIKTELNLSTITSDCQTLPLTKTVYTLIDFLLDGYCTQKTQIEALIAENLVQAAQILNLQNSVCP